MLKLVNNNTTLNLNTASYFINILASSYESTWKTTSGTTTKTINHLVPTKHHHRTVEITWHMVNMCKDMEQQYTGKILERTLVNLTFNFFVWTQYSYRYDGKPSWTVLHNPYYQLSFTPRRS